MDRETSLEKDIDMGNEDFLLCSVVDERWCLCEGDSGPSVAVTAGGGIKRDRKNLAGV